MLGEGVPSLDHGEPNAATLSPVLGVGICNEASGVWSLSDRPSVEKWEAFAVFLDGPSNATSSGDWPPELWVLWLAEYNSSCSSETSSGCGRFLADLVHGLEELIGREGV
jgi:hypothetical protein